jgi:hypothetical protein
MYKWFSRMIRHHLKVAEIKITANEHIMKEFHEQFDSVGQTPQYRDNGMNTHTFTTISCTKTSALPITTTPAHEHQAQTVECVFKVVLPGKMNIAHTYI